MASRNAAVDRTDAQVAFARVLLERVRQDKHPSSTHMEMLERWMPPSLYGVYLNILLEKVGRDTDPSISMLRRIGGFIERL
jgi:hypothetical protein